MQLFTTEPFSVFLQEIVLDCVFPVPEFTFANWQTLPFLQPHPQPHPDFHATKDTSSLPDFFYCAKGLRLILS